MNYLLDTHVLIWTLENNPKLSRAASQAITDGHNGIFVSAVSVWEISIKKAIGKLDIPDNLLEEIETHRFDLLDITAEHAKLAGELPPIHQDPFDRMLIAQSMLDSFTLITRDKTIPKYDIKVMLT